jgi:hypothetical protein
MAVGTLGNKPGNILVPINNLMKASKDVSPTLSSTPAGWTTTLNRCVFRADSTGKWKMNFNISGTFNNTNNPQITVSGVTFSAVGSRQPIDVYYAGTVGFVIDNTGTIVADNVAGITQMQWSGDVSLNAEPDWAAAGLTSWAAIAENTAAIAAYIPFGQAGMPGEEKISETTSDTLVNSSSVFDWAGTSLTLGVGTWDLTMHLRYVLRLDSGTGDVYGFAYVRDTSDNLLTRTKLHLSTNFQGSGVRTMYSAATATERVVITSGTKSYKISANSPNASSSYMFTILGSSDPTYQTYLRAVRVTP